MSSNKLDSFNRKRDFDRINPYFNKQNMNSLRIKSCGILLALGFTRVVYGDHGPYVEFIKEQLNKSAWKRVYTAKPNGYYHINAPRIGKYVKLYYQLRDVHHLPCPPKDDNPWATDNYRSDGYADYKPGMLYISADRLLENDIELVTL